MNWDAVGAVGETVGAIAVLATLIYLSVQVRAMRNSAIGDAIRQITDTEIILNQMELENASLIIKANQLEALEPEESFKLERIYHSQASIHFHNFLRAVRFGYSTEIPIRNFVDTLQRNPAYRKLFDEQDWLNIGRANPKEWATVVYQEIAARNST